MSDRPVLSTTWESTLDKRPFYHRVHPGNADTDSQLPTFKMWEDTWILGVGVRVGDSDKGRTCKHHIVHPDGTDLSPNL